MNKSYGEPRLAIYGRLEDLTLGVGGTAPDLPSIGTASCITGTVTNVSGQTVTITCVSLPSH
jgi:hypothetical protein